MRTRIDGFEIEYDVRGKGPAVLLLHAFPLGRSMWEPQVESLATTRRVVRFDARGFGGSELDDVAPLTMERIADDGACLLDQLWIDEAVVHGCSMGGYAAFAFARRHPRRLAGLVLQDTRAAADTPQGREGRAALAARVLDEGATAVVDALLPKLLGETSHRERPALVATLKERVLASSPRAVANALYGLAARADSRAMLPGISVPTLVLVGEEDANVSPDEAKVMAAAIPGARLEVIPRAGHLANLENPDAVNAAVCSFLMRQRPGPTALDTAVFVHYIEENETFLPLVSAIFEDVAAGRREVVTSSLTLLEVLVVPYRAGNLALAERQETYLSRSRGVRLLDIGRPELRVAAQLRALHASLRTPDALPLAAGVSAGSHAFVTNDRDLPSIGGLKVVQLRNYLSRV